MVLITSASPFLGSLLLGKGFDRVEPAVLAFCLVLDVMGFPAFAKEPGDFC